MKIKHPKGLKQAAALIEHNTEASLILFGLLAVCVAFLPVRLDIQLLLGGFGFFLVITGIVAKFVCEPKEHFKC